MKLPVILIGEDNIALVSLRQELARQTDFLVEPRVHSFERALDLLRAKAGPVLAIFDLSRDPERAFRVAQEIKFKFPNTHLIMTSPENNPQTILRAMRSGAEEFLAQPFNWNEVFNSLAQIREKIHLQLSTAVERGRIVAVFANRGGVGSTTVASNLAVSLASQKQKSVCLVDLVLQFGAVASFLNLEPSYTILDLVKNLKRIDPLLLEGSLVRHSSGVRVLAEPFCAEDAGEIKPSDIDQILDTVVKAFNFVIVDNPKGFDESVFITLEKASLILFVMEMDIPSLKSASRALELFDRVGVSADKLRLVLNRYVKSKLITLESVEKTLGTKVFWSLPNDYPSAIAALNQGLSIQEADPKSALAKSYEGLTDALIETVSFLNPAGEGRKSGAPGRWSHEISFNTPDRDTFPLSERRKPGKER